MIAKLNGPVFCANYQNLNQKLMQHPNTAFFILILAAGLISCQRPERTPAAAKAANGPSESIFLTQAQVNQAQIELGDWTELTIAERLSAPAELVLPVEHLAQVAALASGVIGSLPVRLNQKVAKGAVIAVLQVPDLLDLQQSYLETKDQLEFLQADFERFQALREADATAAKNLQKAAMELRLATTRTQVLGAKLQQYGINPTTLTAANVRSTLAVVAPISGLVTRLAVGPGAAVQPGTLIAEVAALEYLQPVAQVYEREIDRIEVGQRILFTRPGQTTPTFPGIVVQIDRTMDPARKTVAVRAKLSPPQPQLVQGAVLQAQIEVGAPQGPSQALPEQAIVREDGTDFIFYQVKKTAEGQYFRKVPVRLGAAANGMVALQQVPALPAAARLVTRGAYYLAAQDAGITVEE